MNRCLAAGSGGFMPRRLGRPGGGEFPVSREIAGYDSRCPLRSVSPCAQGAVRFRLAAIYGGVQTGWSQDIVVIYARLSEETGSGSPLKSGNIR